MPPRPRNSRMSNCGKCFASSSTFGGSKPLNGEPAEVAFASASRVRAIRHLGQMPWGASGASFEPHSGQVSAFFMGALSIVSTLIQKQNLENVNAFRTVQERLRILFFGTSLTKRRVNGGVP